MIQLVIIGLAVLAGYIITVGLVLLSTMAIASAVPSFVIANYRVRGTYKLVHEIVWFFCTAIGTYVTVRIGSDVPSLWLEVVFATVLLGMLWLNNWEARQRGISHQILISVLTVAGIMAGTSIAVRSLH